MSLKSKLITHDLKRIPNYEHESHQSTKWLKIIIQTFTTILVQSPNKSLKKFNLDGDCFALADLITPQRNHSHIYINFYIKSTPPYPWLIFY
jgi:hypothetical protein